MQTLNINFSTQSQQSQQSQQTNTQTLQSLDEQILTINTQILTLQNDLRNLKYQKQLLKLTTKQSKQQPTNHNSNTNPSPNKYKDPNQKLGRPRLEPSQLAPSTRAQYARTQTKQRQTICSQYAARYAQDDVVNYNILSQLPLEKARKIFFNMDHLTVDDPHIAMRKCILHNRYAYTLEKCNPNGPFRLDPNQIRFHSPECIPEWEQHKAHLLTVVNAFATLLQVPVEDILAIPSRTPSSQTPQTFQEAANVTNDPNAHVDQNPYPQLT